MVNLACINILVLTWTSPASINRRYHKLDFFEETLWTMDVLFPSDSGQVILGLGVGHRWNWSALRFYLAPEIRTKTQYQHNIGYLNRDFKGLLSCWRVRTPHLHMLLEEFLLWKLGSTKYVAGVLVGMGYVRCLAECIFQSVLDGSSWGASLDCVEVWRVGR